MEAKGIAAYIRRGFDGEPAAIPPILYDPNETIPGKTVHEDPARWVAAFIYPVKDEAANTGLGLIDSTGRHDLRGTISYENRSEGGARVVVTFPLPRATTGTREEPS